MRLQTERITAHEATTAPAPSTHRALRGGSYVTLPESTHDLPHTEGTYVTRPCGDTGNGERVQGRYVTLHTAPLDETEGSYTRRS